MGDIAKQKKIVGYYKLPKADLIAAISKHGGGVMDLLDTPVPENGKHINKFLLRIHVNTFH